MNIAGWQWLVLLLILLLLFGATKLPKLARSLGESARIFKSEVKTMQDNDEESKESERDTVEGEVMDPTADVHKSRERRDFS